MDETKTTKKTLKELYGEVLVAVEDNPELKTFIEGRIALLDKKSNKTGEKQTKGQEENLELADKVYNFMAENKVYSIAELQKALDVDLSFNKVSYLVKLLKDNGKVTRSEAKGKAYFTKA